MSTPQIIGSVVAAALLFWIVGAYNRLVRLRSSIVQQFAAVDEQVRLRHPLLLAQIDALAPVLANAGDRLEALRAACGQVEAACAHAKQRPRDVGAITSLRLAEAILGEARARLPAQALRGTELDTLNTQLAAGDLTLAFARRQFNDAVTLYNDALAQFPTALIAGLFGFGRAATL